MAYIPEQKNPLTLFNSLDTAVRIPIIELKSNYGLSNLRDIQSTSGSATISNDGAEYNVSTGATTGSNAILDSAERGRYIPGAQAQAGIGIRLDETFTGTSYAQWGYFDADDGFGFGVDATGVFTFIRRGGSDTKTYQSNWSHDVLDGTGASGITLDLADGNIFQLDYSWYGYGTIEYRIVLHDSNNNQKAVIVNKYTTDNSVTVDNPNLPLRVEVDNGDTTTDYDVFVGGRQYSVYVPFNPNTRVNSHRRNSLGSIGTTFLPVISFRRKSTGNFESVAAKIRGFDLKVDTDMYYQIRFNGSLSGASYGTPADTTASETAFEVDTSASAISGGELVYQGSISASGAGVAEAGSLVENGLGIEIPALQPVTLCVRTVTGTGATATGAVVRWSEEW